MVARSVTMMPLPLGSASSMPYSTRNWALASESMEMRASLPRWLAPLMSVVLTGILVSKQKALSGKSSLILATAGFLGLRFDDGAASYSYLCPFSSCGLIGYLALCPCALYCGVSGDWR